MLPHYWFSKQFCSQISYILVRSIISHSGICLTQFLQCTTDGNTDKLKLADIPVFHQKKSLQLSQLKSEHTSADRQSARSNKIKDLYARHCMQNFKVLDFPVQASPTKSTNFITFHPCYYPIL